MSPKMALVAAVLVALSLSVGETASLDGLSPAELGEDLGASRTRTPHCALPPCRVCKGTVAPSPSAHADQCGPCRTLLSSQGRAVSACLSVT